MFLFHGVPVYLCSLSGVRLCDPVDCSPPGSSVHGILLAGIWSGLPLLLQFIYTDAHLWLPLSVVSTLLHVLCFLWVLFFRCFSFSVMWELSSMSALVIYLYFKMSKKKKNPCRSSLPMCVQDGRGAAGKPMTLCLPWSRRKQDFLQGPDNINTFSSLFFEFQGQIFQSATWFFKLYCAFFFLIKAGCNKMNISLQYVWFH